jgi:hypothetical protein
VLVVTIAPEELDEELLELDELELLELEELEMAPDELDELNEPELLELDELDEPELLELDELDELELLELDELAVSLGGVDFFDEPQLTSNVLHVSTAPTITTDFVLNSFFIVKPSGDKEAGRLNHSKINGITHLRYMQIRNL